MPGAVVAVSVEDGAEVEAGTVVVTVEAMKMEHPLAAPVDGVVELLVAVGDQVKVGQQLARITALLARADDDDAGAARIEEWRMTPAGDSAVGAPPARAGGTAQPRKRRGGRRDEEERR
jgi:pyruvate/2-oxoglutarate dehydrogenase complex dihydrolipoamide acyltransferase (E2) component